MGFRFRKSVKLPGGFRVNFSKSGVGYSWGVPGARITKTAKGTTRTTVGIPGTGLSYVEESSNKKNNSKNKEYWEETTVDNLNGASTQLISNDDTEDVASYNRSITQYNFSKKGIGASLIGLFCSLLALADSITLFAIIFVVFGISMIAFLLKYSFAKRDLQEGFIVESGAIGDSFKEISNTWHSLENTTVKIISCVARIDHSSKGRPTASTSNIKLNVGLPEYIRTEEPYFSFNYKNNNFYLFAGGLLNYDIISKRISYVDASNMTFIIGDIMANVDPSEVESDANIINTTWEKTNKNGERDKRYKNNHKIYTVNYGTFSIEGNGLDMDFIISNKDYMLDLEKKININECEYKIRFEYTED